jgi:riboflavin kinase/FMN adenylyltransferase
MNTAKDLEKANTLIHPIITIGSFDGLHLGHKALIERIINLAKAEGTDYALITFEPHPRQIIYPNDNELKLLTTLEEKLFLFHKLGISNIFVVPFSIEFSQISADEYIEKFIVQQFHPSIIVIGYDHRFGLNRNGDINFLRWHSERLHYRVEEISAEMVDEIIVSSTKIRKSLENTQLEKANQMLGHHYIIHGKVIHGQKIGRDLGFPTANLLPSNPKKLIPTAGIYAAYAHIDDKIVQGAVYIGKKSSVIKDQPANSIELHCFDFDGDLYDKNIYIELVNLIREDQHFDDIELLKQQINKDIIVAKNILSKIDSSFIITHKVN